MPRKIDLTTWPRREIFEHFSSHSDPFYCVAFKADVTNLYRYAKENGLSFYYALVYLSTKAVNSVENFRYAIDGGDVILLEERKPSFTDMNPGSELFHIVTMPCGDSLPGFCREARARSRAQSFLLDPSQEAKDLIYFSCLPWIEMTANVYENITDKDEAIPRISWGRYAEAHGRKTLHMSMELNHRFIDGLHIGRFYEALTALIEGL